MKTKTWMRMSKILANVSKGLRLTGCRFVVEAIKKHMVYDDVGSNSPILNHVLIVSAGKSAISSQVGRLRGQKRFDVGA